MNMTDHKYPNEIASCHSMLKKRDAIIAEMNTKKSEDLPATVVTEQAVNQIENLSATLDKTLKENSEIQEANNLLGLENTKLFADLSMYRIKTENLEKEAKALQHDLDSMPSAEGTFKVEEENAKLIEELKLAKTREGNLIFLVKDHEEKIKNLSETNSLLLGTDDVSALKIKIRKLQTDNEELKEKLAICDEEYNKYQKLKQDINDLL